MYSDDAKGISYTTGFFILIGLWIAGLIVGSIVIIPIWLVLGSGNVMDMAEKMLLPEYANAVRLIQVVSTACIFFLPAYITAYIINKKPDRFLGFNRQFTANQLLLSCVLIFMGALVAGAAGQLMEAIPLSPSWEARFKTMEDNYAAQVESIASMNSFKEYLVALFMIAALPALFEETFFRGGMQNLLTRSTHNAWLAIIMTSVVFSLVHFSFYGFLARVCLGIVLGLIYYYSKNLWLSVVAHFVNNGIAVTQMYYLIQQGKSVREAMDDKIAPWWGIAAIAALYFLFVVFKRASAKYLASIAPKEKDPIEQWLEK